LAVQAERGEIGTGVDAVPRRAAEAWAEQRTDRIGAVRDHWNIAPLEIFGDPPRRDFAAPAAEHGETRAGGSGRFLTRELCCDYLGVDASASAVAVARERAGDLPCRFATAHVPPVPAGSFDVVLLLETMLAFEDKDPLVREIAAALRPGGRLAFTLEERPPLTTAERAVTPRRRCAGCRRRRSGSPRT
jgi:SAM-dependent methyltransferase